jgi:hypothetical protein
VVPCMSAISDQAIGRGGNSLGRDISQGFEGMRCGLIVRLVVELGDGATYYSNGRIRLPLRMVYPIYSSSSSHS